VLAISAIKDAVDDIVSTNSFSTDSIVFVSIGGDSARKSRGYGPVLEGLWLDSGQSPWSAVRRRGGEAVVI